MSNQTHTSDSIYFTAYAQHYEAQRSITMLYRPTVRDETNNAENVWEKSTAFIHSVMRTREHTHVLYFTSKYVAVIAADLK